MNFRPIAGFPNGWQLGYRFSPTLYLLHAEMPYYRRSDGAMFTPEEAAVSESGPLIFHMTKRWLDIADKSYGRGAAQSPEWRAVDKAKFAMETALRRIGAWSNELLTTEVNPLHGRSA